MGFFKEGRNAKGTGMLTDKYFYQGDSIVIGRREAKEFHVFQVSEGLKKAGAGLFLGGKKIQTEFFDRIRDLKFNGILHNELGSLYENRKPRSRDWEV